MKFKEIFGFELKYQLQRLSTWLFLGMMLLFGAGIVRSLSSDIPLNSPSTTAFFTVASGAIWLIIGAAVAGDAAARDHETRMQPLMHSAPISKTEYLCGRFLAAFTINALILLMVPLGILISLYLPGITPEARGPFRAAGYLTAYGFIALPNALVVTAIQFAAATRSRRAISAYLASVGMFMVSHIGGSAFGYLLGIPQFEKTLDMVGLIGIIGTELETWSPIDQRSRLLALEGPFLWNRLIWLGAAAAALSATYARFRFVHPVESSRWSWLRRKTTGELKPAADSYQTLGRSRPKERTRGFGFATYARQTLAIMWTSFVTIARTKTGLTLVTLLALIIGLFLPEFMQFNGVPMLPRTERVIRSLIAPLGAIKSQWVIIPLLTIFYAGELVWRERDARVSEMADAAPVPEAVLFLGKFLGLALLLTIWMVILIGGGVLGQTLMSYRDFELPLYVQQMLGLQLANYLLFALLVLVIQVVVNSKYLGQLAALVAFGFIAFAGRLGFEHHLLVFASSPGWSYSAFSGYGADLLPWMWLKLYWTGWAILLAIGAKVMWVRSKESGLRARLVLARRRLTNSTLRVAAFAMVLVLSTGAFTFYNTNVLNTYRNDRRRAAERVEYERLYGKYEGIAQPRLTAARYTVDIFASRKEANIQGQYRLVNATHAAIGEIHVATIPRATTGEIRFDRAAKNVVTDDVHGHRIYSLTPPLAPGEELKLDFEVNTASKGFENSPAPVAVLPSVAYFKNQDWLPAIGFQSQRLLSGDADRRKYGLGPRPRIPSLYDSTASRERGDAELISVETVLSTDEGQTAVAPGIQTRAWNEGGRRYFHYVTDAPIGNEYSFFSAAYEVEKARWNDVAIELFYLPRQKENVARMVSSVQSSLNYYSEAFGPYPYKIVRFVARPGAGVGMHADASTVDYSEGMASINPNPRKRELDLVSFVAAHEISHQWWGLQVAPARMEGAGLLGEGLANYSALRMMEHTFGGEQVRYLLSMWRRMYEEPRTRASTPVLQAADQFASYRKGPFALYTLSQYIGDAPIAVVLRRMVEKYGNGQPPLPTSIELYRELQAVTPDTAKSLLHDLFEKNTFWDLETDSVSMRESAAGTWDVTLHVNSRKTVVDVQGVITNIPMNDWVEIGVFEADTVPGKTAEPLYLQKHRVMSGQQTITVTVPRKPSRAGIDPRYLLLGRASEDNMKSLAPAKVGM